MGSFALLPSPMTGHVNPTLPIAGRLVADGHEVTFHLPERFRAEVEAVGAVLCPIPVLDSGPFLGGTDPVTRFALVPAWLTAATEEVLPVLLDGLGDTRPDVIVYDMTCVWGRVLGRMWPGRTAMVVGSYVSNDRFSPTRTSHYRSMAGPLEHAFVRIGEAVARLNQRYGITLRPRELFARDEEVVIVVMPRAFHPAGDSFDHRFVFAGACLRDERIPTAERIALDADRPTLFVSAGTLLSMWPGLVEACYEGFCDRQWQVVIAAGDQRDLPPAPSNFLIRPHVPQLSVLSGAAAFVTHGGTNSVMEALQAATPMVAIPRAPEHAITADRLVELGLGRQLRHDGLTAASLRAAVDEVATSTSVREQLLWMQQESRASGGHHTAAAALQGMLRREPAGSTATD